MGSSSMKELPLDMGRIEMEMPASNIVLLSWIVNEYDGLGFVRTDSVPPPRPPAVRTGRVSLFFPAERREDVLELLRNLEGDGVSLRVLFETGACISDGDGHDKGIGGI